VLPEGLGKLKKKFISSDFEPATMNSFNLPLDYLFVSSKYSLQDLIHFNFSFSGSLPGFKASGKCKLSTHYSSLQVERKCRRSTAS
jgi:hypothetical protein